MAVRRYEPQITALNIQSLASGNAGSRMADIEKPCTVLADIKWTNSMWNSNHILCGGNDRDSRYLKTFS
uniref:Uncharacterized protein n=1 Tax=Dulem virus 39 TaxID=3145757 RepID=A0AAU8B5Z6_9CAUD